jgi:hypothetical protein
VLSVVTETSVYLSVAHQRTSGSGSTIHDFRRHVTILSTRTEQMMQGLVHGDDDDDDDDDDDKLYLKAKIILGFFSLSRTPLKTI